MTRVEGIPGAYVVAAVLLAGVPARAATLSVPGDYATVAEAVAVAAGGDVVEVAAGEHSVEGQIDVPSGITLHGAGADVTTLTATGDFTMFFLGDSSGVVVEGFTFVPYSGRAAFTCWDAAPAIGRNVFLGPGNGISGCGGTFDDDVFAGCNEGVYAHGDSPTIVNNVFAGCHWGVRLHFVIGSGGHVDANPRIFNNVFVDNDEAVHNHQGSPPNDYTRSPAYNLFLGNGSDCEGCTLGSPNLFENPVFVTYTDDGDFTDDDFHIVAESSPCVEAGTLTHEGADAPARDFDGETRPMGAAPEIGIDEVVGQPPVEEEPEEIPDAAPDVAPEVVTDAPADVPGDAALPEGQQESGCGCTLVA
jgi:hypothetical protein